MKKNTGNLNRRIVEENLKKIIFSILMLFSIAWGQNCKAQGVDVVFWMDNSGSIDATEWTNMSASTKTLIDKVLECNPGNRVSVVHYGTPIYIETDFTNNATIAKSFVRRSSFVGSSDYADSAIDLIGNALDGTANSGIVSPQKKLTKTSTNKLVIFFFTDAERSESSSTLVANGFDPSRFSPYNNFKINRDATFVVLKAPTGASDPQRDIDAQNAAAAIASVGGGYMGNVEINAGDPQGSGVKPRKMVATSTFNISGIDISTITDNICKSCAPDLNIAAVTPPTQQICQNTTAQALVANATGIGTLNYQWYRNTTNSNTGGTLISGATSASYTPPTSVLGTNYYYVVSSDSYCEGKSTSITVSVTVSLTACQAATCNGTANISPNGTTIINGVTIISASLGAVAQYVPAFYGSCASLSSNSLLVGRHATAHNATTAPWTITLNFDQPVNDLVLLLAGGGNLNGVSYIENFLFNGNNGPISTSASQYCQASTAGNEIQLWSDGVVNTDGGGRFKIHSTRPFTQLTISGNGGADGAYLGICNESIKPVPPKCFVSNANSTTGWKAKVYDGVNGMNSWAQISASNSFPTASYTQVATFDYNENINSNYAFDILFGTSTYGLRPANPKIQNYVGTQIYNDQSWPSSDPRVNEDYAILFSKTIANGEEGSYQFDLGYGDDHIFIYKNGVKLNQQENAYNVTPLDNFITINLVAGDIISILVVEEYEFNTEVQLIVTKLIAPPVKNLTNICPSNTVNLNDAHTGTIPSNNLLLWFNNNTHTGTPLTLVQIGTAGAGTYYAFYYNSTANCYSLVSSMVTVTAFACPSYCYKPAVTTGFSSETKHGISALGRAGVENGNWPMIRNNAWTALESKTKGFVINRISSTTAVSDLPNPVEGMMVYDEEADCLKINTDGTSTGWKCFNVQACP